MVPSVVIPRNPDRARAVRVLPSVERSFNQVAMMRSTLALVFALMAASPAAAQTGAAGANGQARIDRVIAVVGDTALLESDLLREIDQFRAGGGQVPEDSAAFAVFTQGVLNTVIDDLILVTAAREAGTVASEDAVNEQVTQGMDEMLRQFPSEIAFTTALAQAGMTRDQFRLEMAAQRRDEVMVRSFLGTRMQYRSRPVINENEIQAFFDAQGGSLGERPATVSFRQVVVLPRPSAEARLAAQTRAEEALAELVSGGEFDVLARRFSDDEGTREHGGDLGWFRSGSLVPEVERAAFSMSPGQTSGIVESAMGLHIIRLDRARGAERQARHILIRPEVTESDLVVARQRADSVATAVRDGESIATLATRYNSSDDPAIVTQAILDRLPAEFAEALTGAAVGDIIGPVQVAHPQGSSYAVVRLTERTEAGRYTLADVRDQIREQLQQQAIVQQLLEELREQVYVNILM